VKQRWEMAASFKICQLLCKKFSRVFVLYLFKQFYRAHATHTKVQHVLDLLVLIDQSASAFSIYANLNLKMVQSFANFPQIYTIKTLFATLC